MRRAVAVLGVMLPLLLAGCIGGRDEMDADDKLAILRQRPSIEEMVSRYQEMVGKMQRELDAALGPHTWLVHGDMGASGCGFDFDGANGHERSLADSYFAGNLPDADWPRAVEVVAKVGREYGFGDPVTIVDRPADHEVTAGDQYGGTWVFGTAANTILTGRTGCHLSEADLANTPAEPSR